MCVHMCTLEGQSERACALKYAQFYTYSYVCLCLGPFIRMLASPGLVTQLQMEPDSTV